MLKAILAVPVFVTVWLASYWLLFVQILPDDLAWMAAAALATAAMVAAWKAMAAGGGGILATTLAWSAALGAIGFCGGFFGPMIFARDANQGPLLGLLITGPLGFAGGAAIGLFRGARRNHRKPA